MKVLFRLHMDGDDVGSCFLKPRDEAGGFLHHEVNVNRQFGERSNRRQNGRSKGHIRHKMAVHHVKMYPVRVPIGKGDDIATEVGEVGGEDGWRNLDHGLGTPLYNELNFVQHGFSIMLVSFKILDLFLFLR